ncbi:C4-dicarboxylate transporter [Roseivirga sp. 4D4]|uniref:dicarboxylate/amino acid:cation symporter n=1 Tax=Roseivirga sp. 4D4 TaxID=1889784 RepID=UPI000852F61E|nr:dicarboxylate/amino acid:cation symporter [Roseivirga sp. 4D4]OEK00927.1 C4-dicarboxylate transporter [Roseivirga sp. 4D4]
MVEVKPLNDLVIYLRKLIEGKLWLKVIIAIILGLIVGMIMNPASGVFSEALSQTIGNWLSLPGRLFLKLVQMIMIPLIFASIISGIVSNSNDQLKKMGFRLLTYFLLTTTASIAIGSALTILIQPGRYIHEKNGFSLDQTTSIQNDTEALPLTNIPEAISDLIPENPLAAMVTGEMLSIVVFTIIIGIAIIQLPKKTIQPVLGFLEAIEEISMTIVSWAMLLVPYAAFGLIAEMTASVGIEGLAGIGYYIGVVLLGLFLLLILYMIVVFVLGGMNPFTFLSKIREVQLLAFSTTSSAAVMPLSMKTADEKLGVASKISDFVIPVGATINMDGTAIFQCISALFIAQAYGIEMGVMNTLLITVTIVAASIGTPAIPGGGVVILASVLQSAGIPTEGLVIIVGVDRILGMFRTAVNVTGDLTACVVFDRWQKKNETP